MLCNPRSCGLHTHVRPLPQGICYLSDASYYRAGVLPRWYATLRGYLTTLAMLSMLSTTAYYFKKVSSVVVNANGSLMLAFGSLQRPCSLYTLC